MNLSKIVSAGLVCASLLIGGCATQGNPKDPLEGFNRAMYAVNEGLDKVLIKPVAQGYDFVVPLPGKVIVSNFFSNLTEPWTAANNLLQAKPGQAFSDVGRFVINSTVGIGGAFDVASELGLEKHEEDLGQTLGRWGVGDGPYVVLPLFGGRTTRDALALIADGYANPLYYMIDDVPTRNILAETDLVSDRAQLLPVEKTIDEAALDKYGYLRDAYLQRRRSLLFDGNPPRIRDEDAGLSPVVPLASAPDAMRAPGMPLLVPGPVFNENPPSSVITGSADAASPGAR